MAKHTPIQVSTPVGLLNLPDELLLGVFSLLSTQDLRYICRVNYRFHNVAGDYLARQHYSTGLLSLPNELILEITQHLSRQQDRSRLARASNRLYPVVMRYVVRSNVRFKQSSLLNYAATKNLKSMARKILHLGGDVDTQKGACLAFMGNGLSPLAIAAFYGYEGMVILLLKAGASHFIGGRRIPLAIAISKRHENVAMILSQELESSVNFLGVPGYTALQMACGAKLVNLVRFYLELGEKSKGRLNDVVLHDRSTALHRLLRMDAAKDEFIKRELHEDGFQIISMLLQHKADPDVPVQVRHAPKTTARDMASRHPDPRIRIRLSKAARTTGPKMSALKIGRFWMTSAEREAGIFYESQPEEADLDIDIDHHATLWSFLENSSADISTLIDEDGTEHIDFNTEPGTLSASEIVALVDDGAQTLRRSEYMDPPPLSSFPQLATPKINAQQAAQTFWANIPAKASPVNDTTQELRTGNMGVGSRKVKQAKKPQTEPFPQLVQQCPTSNNASMDLWAHFPKDKISQSTSGAQRICPHMEGGGVEPTAHKSPRKKKWVPLLI